MALLRAILTLIKKGLEALMKLPILNPGNTSRVMTDVFRGYNHNLKIADGEMYDTTNLTSDYYPMLASRKKRVIGQTYTTECTLIDRGDIDVRIVDGILYVNGDKQMWYTQMPLPVASGLNEGPARQIVRFGTYAIIWPDAVWVDLSTFFAPGTPGNYFRLTTVSRSDIKFQPCDEDGDLYEDIQTGTEPASPEDGTMWYDEESGKLKKYTFAGWVEVQPFTKVTFLGATFTNPVNPNETITTSFQGVLPALFSAGDFLSVYGLHDALDGSYKYLSAIGGVSGSTDDYLVLPGWTGAETTTRTGVAEMSLTEIPQMDHGSMGAVYNMQTDGASNLKFEPCDVDGNVYTGFVDSLDDPEDGDLYYDSTNNEIVKYSSVQADWVKIETVYTRITFLGLNVEQAGTETHVRGVLPARFKAGDAVKIDNLGIFSGTKYIYAIGGDENTDDYIVLIGLIGTEQTVYTVKRARIEREVPSTDILFECQNRLWGCNYIPYTGHNTVGQAVNEIFCSALGDFKNWKLFQGLSTDSWVGSVGAPGAFTGGINYLGRPTFFKEDKIFVVTISGTGAHRIDETDCRGVQKGSGRSLQVVGETLYYKGVTEIMAWQGGFPISISTPALGDVRYRKAVGGTFGNKYYLSMQSGPENNTKNDLFVYDISRGFWLREDDTRVKQFSVIEGDLLGVTESPVYATEVSGTTLGGQTLAGTVKRVIRFTGDARTGESTETDVEWAFETGLMYYEYPDKKYVSRYNIRLQMEPTKTAAIYIEYDSSGNWGDAMTFGISGTGTATIPIRPRRCDHLRMKITGTGAVKILSIARILEVGSDV